MKLQIELTTRELLELKDHARADRRTPEGEIEHIVITFLRAVRGHLVPWIDLPLVQEELSHGEALPHARVDLIGEASTIKLTHEPELVGSHPLDVLAASA